MSKGKQKVTGLKQHKKGLMQQLFPNNEITATTKDCLGVEQ